MNAAQTNANVFGNIVPLSSQDMYATFVVNTDILGCQWVNSSSEWQDDNGDSCTPSTGGSGGELAGISQTVLNVPSDITPHIQETHLWVEHLLCWLVEDILSGKYEKI